ncbi:MAG: hypothetical protein GX130_04495 [Candidatus Hydrogenedens sp.]|nr:hypothetical protein [Candidatus Hydrogenedens sp.]
MSKSDERHILREKNQKTFYFALLLLFFFQLFGRWIESIYRLSLIKLDPGLETAGLLLFLYALVFLVVPKKKESLFLKGSVFLFLLLRFLCPFLPIRIQVIVAGLGVANFLILYAAWLSKPYRHLQGDAGYALILSIFSYILLRSLGYSVDISMDGSSVLACAALVAMAVYFTWRHFAPQECEEELTEKQENESSGCWMDVLSAFGNFALVVFFFTVPHTLVCWFGYEDAHVPGRYYVSALLIWLVLTDTEKLSLHSGKGNIIYNALFAGLLVSCLILGRPQLPATVADVNTIALHEPPNFLLICSFIVALVLPVNIRQIQARCTFPDPQAALLRVVPTFLFLLTLALLSIIINVWGYVPGGSVLRNHFYLPFLLMGLSLMLPWRKGAKVLTRQRLGIQGRIVFILLAGFTFGLQLVQMVYIHPEIMSDKKSLRIGTYNIQQGSNLSGEISYREQCALLESLDLDIIALQESDTARISGGFVDPVRYFAETLGYYVCYGPGTISGSFGTALLSRYPIHSGEIVYTFSDRDEIATLHVLLSIGGKKLSVSCNHPDGGEAAMTAHVLQVLEKQKGYPLAIAMGDFNFTLQEAYRDFLTSHFPATAAEKVSGSVMPDKNIDHIFVTESVEVLESHFIPPSHSHSDHPLHWAVITWKEEELFLEKNETTAIKDQSLF